MHPFQFGTDGVFSLVGNHWQSLSVEMGFIEAAVAVQSPNAGPDKRRCTASYGSRRRRTKPK